MWPERKMMDLGKTNIQYSPLVSCDKILLSLLHIKLGLMKNLVKAMNEKGEAFKYLNTKFLRPSDAKIEEGTFVGPQICELFKDETFNRVIEGKEKPAWEALKNVVHNFLGNQRAENYNVAVNKLLRTYQELGCNMLLKIHFLDSDLDFLAFVALCVTSTEYASIKTLQQWKEGISASGIHLCLQTIVGMS